MGWSGYGTYDGDGTQTCHYNFLKWTKVSKDDEEIYSWMSSGKTKIPKDRINIFVENIDFLLKRMPKYKPSKHVSYYDKEDFSIEWQMLAALLLDNKIKIPEKIYEMTKKSIEFLMGEHASDFVNPGLRRAHLRRFLKKLEANKND